MVVVVGVTGGKRSKLRNLKRELAPGQLSRRQPVLPVRLGALPGRIWESDSMMENST